MKFLEGRLQNSRDVRQVGDQIVSAADDRFDLL
jgi:hypothetical protein